MDKTPNLLLAFFVFVIVQIILATVLQGYVSKFTTTSITANVTFSSSNTTCTAVESGSNCIVSFLTFQNSTSGAYIGNGNFTLCNVQDNNYRGFKNTGNPLYQGNLNLSYVKGDCQYTPVSSAILPIVAVLIWLLMGVAFVLYLMKASGIKASK